MKLKEIHRTSTFAWSPTTSVPLLATGTVAGALDESFSNDSQLEIWAPNFLERFEFDLGGEGHPGPKGAVKTSSRFNRISWGSVDAAHPRGVIATGMENGELGIWDPAKILAAVDESESLILRNNTHKGPVRGLDFNPLQPNLLSSGATNAEIFIWDLKDPTKPYSPGTRSSKLDEITALQWNNQVPHVLGTASSTGYTVVWDLRGKREVVALAYSGGNSGHSFGGRKGMSDVAWHPDNATRLATASEDDSSPVILLWDLRNARAPEKILTGHQKGVLSLSWCKQDADLLLSCGKDNRALAWNPQTSEIIGELPVAHNWAFQVQWCPRNPDLLATAAFDGTIGIHSLQSTNDSPSDTTAPPQPDGADIYDAPGYGQSFQTTLSLKQPPKWLRRPVSATFGFGGKLVSINNLSSAQGQHQSGVVHVRKLVTEQSIISRAKKLLDASENKELVNFVEDKVTNAGDKPESTATWKALLSLFNSNSRDELITLLGFSKSEVATQVASAITSFKTSPKAQSDGELDITESKPVVTFAEPEREITEESEGDSGVITPPAEATPSELSASATSDVTNATKAADVESTTEPSLFGDDVLAAIPQTDAAADFFSSLGTVGGTLPDQVVVPHVGYGLDSSVAPTVGSGPPSLTSEAIKSHTFQIYPDEESEIDRLVTKSLVLGDFESAVTLCLSTDRYADAILLAVKGGPDLLQRTQKAYFERRTTALPYLRVFQSIVSNDLTDIVQNADLREWQEIFVILCTFAKPEDFAGLAEQLGERLEFQSKVVKNSALKDTETKSRQLRKHATLCYLAAGKLEKVVNVWISEMNEQEAEVIGQENSPKGASRYHIHAEALQTFIEKVSIFRGATNYVDSDLEQDRSDLRSYKLGALYDRYYEYAELLATQGLVAEAVKYINYTPNDYTGRQASLQIVRERFYKAANQPSASTSTIQPAVAPASTGRGPSYSHDSYPGQQPGRLPSHPRAPGTTGPIPSAYEPYNGGSQAEQYAPSLAPHAPQQPQYQPSGAMQYQSGGTYTNGNAYGGPGYGQSQTFSPPHVFNRPPQGHPMGAIVPPPPAPYNTGNTPPGHGSGPHPVRVLPAAQRRDIPGWNDPPVVSTRNTATPPTITNHQPAAITSPFPNAMPSSPVPPLSPYLSHGQPPPALPPPPRGSTRTPSQPQPPPPRAGQAPPPVASPPQGQYSQQVRPPPPSTTGPRPPPGGASGMPPPGRVLSPSQTAKGPPQNQFPPRGQPPNVGGSSRPPPGPQPNPSGPYSRGTPPPQGPPPQHGYSGPPQHGGPGPRPGPPGANAPPLGPPSSHRPAGTGSGPGPAPPPKAPSGPKYPPGDRSHMPESSKPAYEILSEHLRRMKQTTPPQQKRMAEDTERRLNALFDALNCDSLSKPVVEQLLTLTSAMEARDQQNALAIHLDLLTRGSKTDDIVLWMTGIKQLILRLHA